MFKISMTTEYTSKVDMDKLRKVVTETIQKTSDAGKKSKKDVAGTSAPTPKKSARRPVKNEIDEEEKEEKPKKKIGRPAKTPKVFDDQDDEDFDPKPKKSSSKKIKSRKVYEEYDDDDEDEEEEPVYTPKPSKSRRKVIEEEEEFEDFMEEPEDSRQRSAKTAAKKIEQKYKRIQKNKSSMVPVTITLAASRSPETPSSPSTSSGSKRSSGEGLVEEINLKTPALVSPAVKSEL